MRSSIKGALAATALPLALVAASPATAATPKPKLEVVKIGSPPGKVAPGSPLKIVGRVANFGTKQGLARVQLYISPTKRPGDGALLTTVRVRVPAKKTARFTSEITLPGAARLKAGSYTLIACAKKQGATGTTKCQRPTVGTVVPAEPSLGTPSSPSQQTPGAPSGDPPGGNTPTDPDPDPDPDPPVFTPGALTLGDPIYPQLGNGGYDALNYDIDLDFKPTPNEFGDAATIMTAEARQNLSSFAMDFQLDVNSVEVNGTAATFTQEDATPDVSSNPDHSQPRKLIITPAQGILEDDEFEVAVDFSGKKPEVYTDPDDAIEGWIPGCYTPTAQPQVCDSFFVVGEPVGSQAWFPSNNHPSDKATFDTSITVPTGQTALGAGELTEDPIDNGDGTTTWSWRETLPTATYLVTASSGNFTYRTSSAFELLTGRTIPLYFAVDPSGTAAQQNSITHTLGRTESVMNYLGQRYGAYPFNSNGAVVDRTTGIGYALEVQGKSHYPGSNTAPSVNANTQAHEIAHQWFGNSVSPATWAELWFNEGWAEWTTWTWSYEANNSTTTPAAQWNNNYNNTSHDWSVAPAVLNNDPALLFFPDFPTYVRGAMTIEGYKQIVGSEKFWAFAKKIQSEYKHSTITTRQFIAEAEESAGFTGAKATLLHDYFEQWLYGTTKPTIVPASFN